MSKYILYIAPCLFLLVSCAQPTYVANKHHIPFFDKKEQGQVELSYGSSFAAAGGYSISELVALVASAKLQESKGSDTEYVQNSFYDIGVGLFRLPQKNAPFRLEGFARLGYGRTHTEDVEGNNSWEFVSDFNPRVGVFTYDYWKYAAQLNIGWQWDQFCFGASWRLGYMSMSNITGKISLQNSSQVVASKYVGSTDSYFSDLVYLFRFGQIHGFSLEFQVGMGSMQETVGFSESNQNLIYSLGLTYKFDASY